MQGAVKAEADYKAVREAISNLLDEENYDDGEVLSMVKLMYFPWQYRSVCMSDIDIQISTQTSKTFLPHALTGSLEDLGSSLI